VARALGITLGLTVYAVHRRLRRVGMRNLTLAFPEMSPHERRRLVRGEFISLGRQLAEVCLFPRYTRENVSRVVVYDGFENFERAYARGKGVLFLTGHLGAWELSAFAHSLQGHPLSIVMRSLDNPYIDALIQRYRTLHGNRTVDKDDFVRGLLSAMRAGETVGILMDTNMTPPQGVFVDFFGIPACTASGLARIALRTDAAVGFDPAQIHPPLRSRRRVNSHRRQRGRHSSQHRKIHQSHRRRNSPLSRPVAVGAPPLEDAPARPAAVVLGIGL
jgi:KDO2-lipid IV(A) lauroyltransferase